MKMVFLNCPEKYFFHPKIHACGASTYAKFIAVASVERKRKQRQKRSPEPRPAENQIKNVNHRATTRMNVFSVDRKIPLELSKQRMMEML